MLGRYALPLTRYIVEHCNEMKTPLSMMYTYERFCWTLTFCTSIIGVDPAVVHVHDVDTFIIHEVFLVAVALVSIKVNNHYFTDAFKVIEHELDT